jgi:hypothetical protein
MGYFQIALGLKLQSRGEKQPKIALGLSWAIRTGLFLDTNFNSCAIQGYLQDTIFESLNQGTLDNFVTY